LNEIERIILAPGPKDLLARVKGATLSLIPERKDVLSAPSFQDEAFAATAPLILCLDGIASGQDPEKPAWNTRGALLLVAACPTGSFSSLIVKTFSKDEMAMTKIPNNKPVTENM
jgi:hypothetical protein